MDSMSVVQRLAWVVQVQLAAAVCGARRMTAATALLFTEGGPEDVVLPELTQLEPASLAAALAACATPRRAFPVITLAMGSRGACCSHMFLASQPTWSNAHGTDN